MRLTNAKMLLPASGANGAVIHYKPEPITCSVVELNILMELPILLGQYILASLHHGRKNVLPELFRYNCF